MFHNAGETAQSRVPILQRLPLPHECQVWKGGVLGVMSKGQQVKQVSNTFKKNKKNKKISTKSLAKFWCRPDMYKDDLHLRQADYFTENSGQTDCRRPTSSRTTYRRTIDHSGCNLEWLWQYVQWKAVLPLLFPSILPMHFHKLITRYDPTSPKSRLPPLSNSIPRASSQLSGVIGPNRYSMLDHTCNFMTLSQLHIMRRFGS